MNRMGYRGQFLVWLLMGMVAFCLIGASVVWAWRPHRIRTHLDAVGYVLDRQGIAYEQIRVTNSLTGLLQRDAYAAGIIIQLPGGREVQGSIECHVLHSICSLDVGQLGLLHERLPELDSKEQWPWLAWLDRHLPSLTLPGGAISSATSTSIP